MRVAFVTGATGFVGGQLVPRLHRAGFAVHALARASSERAHLAQYGVTWHLGDLSDPASIRAAVVASAAAGRAALCVHAGAVISYRRGDGALQERVNVEGTRALLAAAAEAAFERVVHVGSVVAVGVSSDGRALLDEEATWDPALEVVDYVRTKRRADELACAARAVVVDPGAIFGPGSIDSNTTRFLDQVRRRGAPPLVPPGGLSVVGVADVADGILAAAQNGRPGHRYLLCESNWSLRRLFGEGAARVGKRGPSGTLPSALWSAVVSAATVIDRLHPLDLLAPQGLRLLGQHYRFDASRARSELGWSPRPFDRVLDETLAWLESRTSTRA
ncbi:NAD-dependent epimerase/dehydratase family protein [Engelhardtia mirabilis]|uniref:Short chain dehydrogenase n=1 Tax=Engelhardtia mirabilis TaxID=2528011 RepID=A0A518BIW0_9BACT|nr:short chain dehydrogenase [Planctomycetes bacterium Pla133]QDV01231.1 short chain dehydrogenase [Planctomycetes bacterium Pla86]